MSLMNQRKAKFSGMYVRCVLLTLGILLTDATV